MRLTIVTIFPDYFAGALADGMIRVALDKAKLQVDVVNLRDFTDDPHRTTDDYPFGGGVGMIMKVEPIDRALASLEVISHVEGGFRIRFPDIALVASAHVSRTLVR